MIFYFLKDKENQWFNQMSRQKKPGQIHLILKRNILLRDKCLIQFIMNSHKLNVGYFTLNSQKLISFYLKNKKQTNTMTFQLSFS